MADEAALVETLEQGRIRGAAPDVFDAEPLPPGHALWRLPNVLLSPHCADNVPGWVHEAKGRSVGIEGPGSGWPVRRLSAA